MECGNLCLNLQEKLSMERKEFSDMLVEARKEAGKSQIDIVFSLGKESFSFVQRIERAGSNYKVKFAQEYVESIGYVVLLQKMVKKLIIRTQDDIVNWVLGCVAEYGSQVKLAQEVKINRALLNPTNLKKTDMSIDSFLSIANVCGYEVKIEKDGVQRQNKGIGANNAISMLNGLSVLGYCLKVYDSKSNVQSIQDKGDMSLFLNQCIKSYGGKEKIAADLNTTLQHISNMVIEENMTVEDFKSLTSKCGYEIKIEKT